MTYDDFPQLMTLNRLRNVKTALSFAASLQNCTKKNMNHMDQYTLITKINDSRLNPKNIYTSSTIDTPVTHGVLDTPLFFHQIQRGPALTILIVQVRNNQFFVHQQIFQ